MQILVNVKKRTLAGFSEGHKWLHFPMKNPVTEQKRESFHCQGLDYSANAACGIGHISSIYRSQCSEDTSINFNSENRFA